VSTIRIEHNFVWHLFAKKGEAARWHFMGSIYHEGNRKLVEENK